MLFGRQSLRNGHIRFRHFLRGLGIPKERETGVTGSRRGNLTSAKPEVQTRLGRRREAPLAVSAPRPTRGTIGPPHRLLRHFVTGTPPLSPRSSRGHPDRYVGTTLQGQYKSGVSPSLIVVPLPRAALPSASCESDGKGSAARPSPPRRRAVPAGCGERPGPGERAGRRAEGQLRRPGRRQNGGAASPL